MILLFPCEAVQRGLAASRPGLLERDRCPCTRRASAIWRLVVVAAAQHERRGDDDDEDQNDEEHGFGSLGDPWALAAGRLVPGVCSQPTLEVYNWQFDSRVCGVGSHAAVRDAPRRGPRPALARCRLGRRPTEGPSADRAGERRTSNRRARTRRRPSPPGCHRCAPPALAHPRPCVTGQCPACRRSSPVHARQDHPRTQSSPPSPRTAPRGRPRGCDDHIKRALADHLVDDHDIPAARIAGFGHTYADESGFPRRDTQEGASGPRALSPQPPRMIQRRGDQGRASRASRGRRNGPGSTGGTQMKTRMRVAATFAADAIAAGGGGAALASSGAPAGPRQSRLALHDRR